MANIVAEFIQSPTDELLDQCTKEQLVKIAQHYSVEVDLKHTKDNLKNIMEANLHEGGVLSDGGRK